MKNDIKEQAAVAGIGAAALHLHGVAKRYGERAVLDRLDLHVPAGQFVAVIGRSAAAKARCCVCWPVWKRSTTAACNYAGPQRTSMSA